MKTICLFFLIAFASAAYCQQGGSRENTLPVMFDSVRAEVTNSGILIGWSNLTERDIAVYIVERSTDGKNFIQVHTRLPLSNKNDKAAYSYFDAILNGNIYFYRIRVNEKFGKIIYSRILKVEIGNVKEAFDVYPNPSTGNQFTISLRGLPKGSYQFKVLNNAGLEVYRKNLMNLGEGITQAIDLPAQVLPGIYVGIIAGSDFQASRLLIFR